MKYTLQYTRHAKKDLEKLSKKAVVHIIEKIEYYCEQKNPLKYSKSLTGPLAGLYRFRIGDYRAIFHKDAKGKVTILTILRIKHRKDIY